MKKIFIPKCDDYNEQAYLFNNIIREITEDIEIVLENKEYIIGGKYAYTDYLYISNNDHNLKKIAFPIINKKNIVINGNGSKLTFVGRIMPFWINNVDKIVIKDLTIDYERPFFSQGVIEEASYTHVKVKINKEKYPYKIKNKKVIFFGRDYESDYIHGLLAYDANKRGPAYGADDNFLREEIDYECFEEDDCLVLKTELNNIPKVKEILTIKHEHRYVPAIAINNSSNIKIENVIIRHAGTMGIVAQYSKDIELNKVQVSTDRNTDRVVSANADATHFVGCSGIVKVTNSLFESQLDDAINVHGNFFEIDKIISNKKIIAMIKHYQQIGVFGFKKGDTLSIINKFTMLEEFEAKIKNIIPLNNKYVEIELNEEIMFDKNKEYCIDDKDTYPSLIFLNNVVRANRARGLLLTSSKEMIIENNTINAEGAAIKISADTDYWYESGPVNKLIIRNNTISSENIPWGRAIIDIDPEMKELVDKKYFHNEILINNNKIILKNDKPFIYGKSVRLLDITNNEFINKEKEIKIDVKNVGELRR